MSSFDKPCENIEARPIGALDQDHESEGAGREARGLSGAKMAIARHRSPDLKWTFELPDRLKLAIADAIVIYSRIESCIVEIIWELERADLPRKQEIAKSWGDQNFRLVKKAVNMIPGTETDAIWPALKALGRERNLIGHGVWMWASDDRPLVVWHAKFLEEDDWVGAEYFDFSRFDYFMRRAVVLANTFAQFKQLLIEALDAEKAAPKAAD
jgi:hypothetical protein